MARQIKKLSLQYQYLKLDYEDILEQMSEYEKLWANRFGKYFVSDGVEMWENTETGELRDTLPEDEIPKTKKNPKLKKIYRQLSTSLHPDKGGNEKDFNKLKEAYEENDILELLNIASDINVDILIEEEDIKLLENSVKSITKKIKEKKTTMIWQYYTGNDQAKKIVTNQVEIITGKKLDPEDLVD